MSKKKKLPDEVIGCRFPAGTTEKIKRVQDEIYFNRSISDYIKTATLSNLKQDLTVLRCTKNFKQGDKNDG